MHHYHYLFLTHSIIISFQNFNDILFVKQLSRILRIFIAKNDHSSKVLAHPSFEKIKRLNQNFNMSLSETQPKIKIPHFRTCMMFM